MLVAGARLRRETVLKDLYACLAAIHVSEVAKCPPRPESKWLCPCVNLLATAKIDLVGRVATCIQVHTNNTEDRDALLFSFSSSLLSIKFINMGAKVSLEEELINLRIVSKQMQRSSKKCEKNGKAAIEKLKGE